MLMTGEPSWEHVDERKEREKAALAKDSWVSRL